MKTHGKFRKLAFLVVTGSLLLSLSILAAAESDAVRAIRASAATLPTNIPGIYTYAAPPKGFNPVAATDEELATYGFPPRPDKQVHPDQYAHWERAMNAAKIHWNGQLKPVPGGGRGMIPAGSPLPEAAQPETGPKQIQTNNASGAVVTSGQKTFNKNSIDGCCRQYHGANGRVPSRKCVFRVPGEGYSRSQLLSGLMGLSSKPAMAMDSIRSWRQELFEQVSCSGDLYYFAVVGWQGGYSVAFNVNPGDVIYAVAYTFGGSNSGVSSRKHNERCLRQLFRHNVRHCGIHRKLGGRTDVLHRQPAIRARQHHQHRVRCGFAETENAKIFYPGLAGQFDRSPDHDG